jgi:hypothetical protein
VSARTTNKAIQRQQEFRTPFSEGGVVSLSQLVPKIDGSLLFTDPDFGRVSPSDICKERGSASKKLALASADDISRQGKLYADSLTHALPLSLDAYKAKITLVEPPSSSRSARVHERQDGWSSRSDPPIDIRPDAATKAEPTSEIGVVVPDAWHGPKKPHTPVFPSSISMARSTRTRRPGPRKTSVKRL